MYHNASVPRGDTLMGVDDTTLFLEDGEDLCNLVGILGHCQN